MPRSRILVTFVFALLALARIAATQPPATTAEGPKDVPQKTQVLGAVPQDLAGRYLVVAQVKLPDGRPRSVARALEIRRMSDSLEIVMSQETLPPDVNQKLNAAVDKAVAWQPAPEDLRAVASRWGKGERIQSDIQSMESKIHTPDQYPPEYVEDEITKDTQLAISIQENYSGRQGAIRSYTLYGVRERTATGFAGSFVTTTLAAAPIPVPITLKGDFRAYRLEGTPAGSSWFQRLFSGCGR